MEEKKFKLIIKPGTGKKSGIPELGEVKELKEGLYSVNKYAIVGRIYSVTCPMCGQKLVIHPTQVKSLKLKCTKCGTKILVGVKEAPKVKPEPAASSNKEQSKEVASEGGNKTKKVKQNQGVVAGAQLQWGGIFSRKSYQLHVGDNYIGRKDLDVPSDVMIDDEYASRRSVKITVARQDNGYSYKFTVENATNPVLVNGTPQDVGYGLYLNYGDTIKLGKTSITFKPLKK